MKELEKKFSFILPVYNGEKYLDKCLNSLVNQHYTNYDIVIINNESTDSSKLIISEYMKKHSNIKLYNSKSKKVGFVRNLGIVKSNCEYFITVDCDDVVDKNMLYAINNNLCGSRFNVIRFNALFDKKSEERIFCSNLQSGCYDMKSYLNQTLLEFKYDKKIFGPSWLYAINKKYFVNNKLHFQNRYQEDFGLIFKILLSSKKIYVMDDILYHYRYNDSGITADNNKKMDKVKDVIYYCDEYIKYFKKLKISKKLFNDLIEHLVIVLDNKFEKLNYIQKKEFLKELGRREKIEKEYTKYNNSNIQ